MQRNVTRTYNFEKMTKIKREYVLVAFLLSGIATALNLASLGTENWVDSQGEFTFDPTVSDELSEINYGLFGGLLKRSYGSTIYYELQITCDFSANVCAMLCGKSASARHDELTKLYNDESVSFDDNCPSVTRVLSIRHKIRTASPSGNREFLNAGLWLTAVVFLCFSSALGLLATGISLWNVISNPIETYFNIFGLYFYNGIACGCSLLTVIVYGAMFASYIFDNVGILYTITDLMDSKGLAYLGYSYWFNVGAFVLYGLSIVFLYVRQYLINKEPMIDINLDDNRDPTSLVF